MDTKRTRQFAVVLAVLAVVLTAFVAPVSAHAYLETANPGNGEQVDDVPSAIELSFSGDGIQSADVQVTGPSDQPVSDDPEIDPTTSRDVTVPIADDGEGTYLVEWEVLADDGHTTSGTFFFVVGDTAVDRDLVTEQQDEAVDTDLSWLEAGSNGLLLLSVTGLVGVPLAFGVAFLPVFSSRSEAIEAGGLDRFERQLSRLSLGLAGMLFVGVVGVGAAGIRSLGSLTPAGLGAYIATPLGAFWLVQLLAAIFLLTILLVGYRLGLPSVLSHAAAVGTGLLVVLTLGWTSHSATAVGSLEGVVVTVVHLGGVALWLGGVIVFAVMLPSLLRSIEPARRRRFVRDLIRRYSVLAIAGVALTTSSGLFLASWHAGGAVGITDTQYGTVLTLKLSLFTLALALGGYHRFVLLGRLDPAGSGLLARLSPRVRPETDGGSTDILSRFTRTVRIELVVLVAVVLLSGVLTSLATGAVALEGTESDIETVETPFEDDIDVAVTMQPTAETETLTVVENELTAIDVEFLRDGDRLEATDPAIRATNRDTGTNLELGLEDDGDNRYGVVQSFPESGDWELRIVGETDGVFGSATVDLTVIDGQPEDGHGGHGEHDDHTGDDGGDGDHSIHDEHGDHTGDEHDHEQAGIFEDPLRIGGLVIGLYGVLVVGYELHALGRRR